MDASSLRDWDVGVDDIALRVVSIAAFATQVGVNIAYSGDVGNVSDTYESCITPSSYTFSIWSLIYIGEAFYNFMIIWSPVGTDISIVHHKVGLFYPALCILNFSWILIWRIGTPAAVVVSTVIIGLMMVILIIILMHTRAWLLTKKHTKSVGSHKHEMVWRADIWATITFDIPFSLYFGWITCATILGITTSIVAYAPEWDGEPFDPETWTWVLVAAATLISGGWSIWGNNPIVPLVVLWACIGIATNDCSPTMVVCLLGGVNAVFSAVAITRLGIYEVPQMGFMTMRAMALKMTNPYTNDEWTPTVAATTSSKAKKAGVEMRKIMNADETDLT